MSDLGRRVAALEKGIEGLVVPESAGTGRGEVLDLTIHHPPTARSAEEVAAWRKGQRAATRAARCGSPPEPGLHVVVRYAPWAHPVIDTTPGPAPSPASLAERPRLRLHVSGRVFYCGGCGWTWPYEGPAADLGPCERCDARWWTTTPKRSGGGSPITL